MNKWIRSFAWLIVFGLSITAIGFGQQTGPEFFGDDYTDASKTVAWKIRVEPAGTPKVGETITVFFDAEILNHDYHMYSSKTEDAAYRPTSFIFYRESKDIKLADALRDVTKVTGEPDPIMGGTMREFKEHKITFKQTFKVTGPNPSIRGALDFQYCLSMEKGGQCLYKTMAFRYDFKADGGETVAENPADTAAVDTTKQDTLVKDTLSAVTPTDTAGGATQVEANAETKEKPSRSLLVIFLMGFGAGFAALLTPCVFPMIPLTVSFFTKQSKTRAQGIKNAIFYSVSIIVFYVGFGLLLSAIFGPDIMYKIAKSPWVNLIFFFIIVAFALSFLGLFEITLPSALVNKIDKQSNRTGLIGIFFMAVTLAVVSFSCTGPLVGSLLFEAAENGNRLGFIMGMLGFSMALAIPFGLFAMFPGMMNSLPKSGGWLNSVKVVLGFLELALAIKFLSNADLVWHLGLMDREVYLAGWIVIFALLGFYLLGKLQLPHDSKMEKIPVPRLMMAIASFWFVFYMLPGLWGAPLKLLSGFLPNAKNSEMGVMLLEGQVAAGGSAETNEICSTTRKYEFLKHDTPSYMCAFYDLDEGIEYAKKANKPIFVDFTGHTCVNCRQMESNVWPDERVKDLLVNDYVVVQLFADEETSLDTPIPKPDGTKLRTVGQLVRDYQKKNYGLIAQPYYALIDHNKTDLTQARGFNLDKDAYVEFLEAGLAEFKKRHNSE